MSAVKCFLFGEKQKSSQEFKFMKKVDYLKELRGMSQEALNERVADLQEELMNIRFKHASGQLEKSSELSSIRERIAQVKTVINEQNALR
jgi:large subunit ribosomal protein L29